MNAITRHLRTIPIRGDSHDLHKEEPDGGDPPMKKTTFLSFGAGIDTTAILHIPEIMERVNFVMFADTGVENPETYSYMEKYSIPFITQDLKLPFVVVRGCEKADGVIVDNLEEACLRWKIIPSRVLRHCTDKFKMRPMGKYIADHYPGQEIEAIVGIAWDEVHRMNNGRWNGYTPIYPLVDRKLTRDGCKRIIREAGWPVPPKSGCAICPFQRKGQWKALRHNHPHIFARAIKLEENGSRFPDFLLSNFGIPLREVDVKLGIDLSAFDDSEGSERAEDDECGGVCMT